MQLTSRCGGTVYALVSKTSPREGLRVRISPPAPLRIEEEHGAKMEDVGRGEDRNMAPGDDMCICASKVMTTNIKPLSMAAAVPTMT